MKNLFYIIFILVFVSSYSQEYDFTELNEKTVNEFLLDGGYNLQNPETNKEGFKYYSSYKVDSNSQLQKKIIFLNGYSIVFENFFKGFF